MKQEETGRKRKTGRKNTKKPEEEKNWIILKETGRNRKKPEETVPNSTKQ